MIVCALLRGELLVCLLYTSDAADDLLCVDLGGRRIIKKKKHQPNFLRRKATYTAQETRHTNIALNTAPPSEDLIHA